MDPNIVVSELWVEDDPHTNGDLVRPLLWPVLQELWAAGERDWLAPYLVKTLVEGEPLDALLRLRPAERPAPALGELLAEITPESTHSEVDWGASVGREAS